MTKRFSVSLEEELLEQFDASIETRGYPTRSEAVRDLIRDWLVRERWSAGDPVMGVVSFSYDHHVPKLKDRISEIQHDAHDLVVSTTHVHVSHERCLEVIIVRGPAGDVARMADALIALKGVTNGHLALTGAGPTPMAGHRHPRNAEPS